LKCIASQIGNLVNVNELSNTAGLTRSQAENYLTILKGTFIIKMLPPFYINKGKEISKMPKLFFSDQGLANFILNDFSEIFTRSNTGNIIENFVFNEIKRSIGVQIEYISGEPFREAKLILLSRQGKALFQLR